MKSSFTSFSCNFALLNLCPFYHYIKISILHIAYKLFSRVPFKTYEELAIQVISTIFVITAILQVSHVEILDHYRNSTLNAFPNKWRSIAVIAGPPIYMIK